jgi:sec-independent protein translocase protein TatA
MAFFGQPGPWEIVGILAVILLLFGGKKLPGLARALGKSLSEFKRGRQEGAREELNAAPAAPAEEPGAETSADEK